MMKKCFDCKRTLGLEKYSRNKDRKDGRSHCCKDCASIRTKKYYNEYPEKRSDKWLKTRYGITIEDYKRMEEEQGGKCYICENTKLNQSKHNRLAVDHCHNTGKVRGLLCNQCNFMLGASRDSISILEKAIEYLKKNGK